MLTVNQPTTKNLFHVDLLLTYKEKSTLFTCCRCPVHCVFCVLPLAGPAGQQSSPSHTPPAALSASCSHAAAWWTFLWTITHTKSVFTHTTLENKVNNFYIVRSSVYYLYSIGINSAARLSWLGLPEGRIPTWKKKKLFTLEYQSDSNIITVRYDHQVRYLLGRVGAVEPECIAAPRWSPSENLSQWSSSSGGEEILNNGPNVSKRCYHR